MSSKNIIAEGYVEWAKIFESNFDDNMDFHEATQGQYNLNFYPDDPADLFDNGFPEEKRGISMLKQGNPTLGTGAYVKLKRPVFNQYLTNSDGEKGKLMNPPVTLDYTNGKSDKVWDEKEQGRLGNGTKVKVLINAYSGRAPIETLERVAVLEQVIFEDDDGEASEAGGNLSF